ncbi:ARM repeat-containing protein [Tilletiopsis washingtonensis]|uniref:ARM repeat-containing protein n=1 Tax=Tilletiopsis washingtonensis TaxID=58919 RepID=A0A316ZF53_9BASI|nr:ARM repeat-containing protein [Tilletiopsis washingtonensis]PWN98903.1 ARM repeat-containing protein [Tilletiopsis washingtonensis]
MFERSLSSLISGLRANAAPQGSHPRSHAVERERRYVAQILDEIRHEVRSDDLGIKGEAVLKVCYLQMLGHTTRASAHSFHMLETMSSPRLHLKHVGYLAAQQCFTPDTDVLILATNLVQKDLHSHDPLEVGIALNGLSSLATPELVPHLLPDLLALLSSPLPLTRKKALLALHALLSRDVTALSSASSALRTALDDADAGVVGATINVLCELSRSSASIAAEFISLSPRLLQLLQRSTNNWTLIKLLKLLALLAPHDASLPASLRAPIIKLIKTTNAASLAYEAINTAIAGGLLDGVSDETRELRGLCVHKLEELGKGDANLRFMARRALRQLERRQSGASSDSGRTLEGLLVEFGAEQQSAASESRQSAPRLAATGKQGKEKGALVDLLGDDEEEQQPQEEEKQMQQGPRHLLDLDDAEQIESFNLHSGNLS